MLLLRHLFRVLEGGIKMQDRRTQGYRTHDEHTCRSSLLMFAWLPAASGARCTSHTVPGHDRCDTRHPAAAARPL